LLVSRFSDSISATIRRVDTTSPHAATATHVDIGSPHPLPPSLLSSDESAVNAPKSALKRSPSARESSGASTMCTASRKSRWMLDA
jgi:hypothetical protein